MNQNNFIKKSTTELIELIRLRNQPSQRENAQLAFEVFYYRFTTQLTKITEIICNNTGLTSVDAVEVVERTFKRFLKYGEKSFDLSKATCNNIDKAITFYLNKIARNVIYDYRKEKLGINISPYNGDEEIIYDFPKIKEGYHFKNTPEQNKHYEIVKKVLSSLTEKHKIIFLTYSAHQINGHKMPRRLLEKLRKELGLKQATLQSYKKEVIDKINEYKNL